MAAFALLEQISLAVCAEAVWNDLECDTRHHVLAVKRSNYAAQPAQPDQCIGQDCRCIMTVFPVKYTHHTYIIVII